MTPEEANQRVEAGAALLDEKRSDDWRSILDVDALDLACTWKCVLGQLYGHYERGHRALWPGGHCDGFAGVDCPVVSHGFDAMFPDIGPVERAWKRYLAND